MQQQGWKITKRNTTRGFGMLMLQTKKGAMRCYRPRAMWELSLGQDRGMLFLFPANCYCSSHGNVVYFAKWPKETVRNKALSPESRQCSFSVLERIQVCDKANMEIQLARNKTQDTFPGLCRQSTAFSLAHGSSQSTNKRLYDRAP